MNPHRSVIDHILTLVGDSALADVLVLRGSVTMLAWAGPYAREPADLDWIVRPVAVQPQDRWWPYPYVDGLHRVRSAPETVHRRPRDELWAAQDYDAEGHRPHLPPDGLRWLRADDIEPDLPHMDLLALLEAHPLTPDGIRLDAAGATFDDAFGYAYAAGYDGAGTRVVVPFDGGTVQIDFAYDETLPEPPVLTAIPRADGTRQALWTASPALSLTWKLQWLAADQAAQGTGDGKDLYDAVLLAELPDIRLSPRLRRMPGVTALDPPTVRTWTVTSSAWIHGSTTDGSTASPAPSNRCYPKPPSKTDQAQPEHRAATGHDPRQIRKVVLSGLTVSRLNGRLMPHCERCNSRHNDLVAVYPCCATRRRGRPGRPPRPTGPVTWSNVTLPPSIRTSCGSPT